MLVVGVISCQSAEARELVDFGTTVADREAARRFTNSRRRRQSLIARGLLRRLLEQETGEAGRVWRFGHDPRGKPQVRSRWRNEPLEISISHSRDVVVCAVTDLGSLGIDVEYCDPRRDIRGIAAAAFGSAEEREVERHGASMFYRIWVLREAHAKALGAGVTTATDRVDRFPSVLEEKAWMQCIDREEWHLASKRFLDDYSIGVAIKPRLPQLAGIQFPLRCSW